MGEDELEFAARESDVRPKRGCLLQWVILEDWLQSHLQGTISESNFSREENATQRCTSHVKFAMYAKPTYKGYCVC